MRFASFFLIYGLVFFSATTLAETYDLGAVEDGEEAEVLEEDEASGDEGSPIEEKPKVKPLPQGPLHGREQGRKTRNFYYVFGTLLREFESDMKAKRVKGLDALSFRRVSLSQNLPDSFRAELVEFVEGRIRRQNKKFRALKCTQCMNGYEDIRRASFRRLHKDSEFEYIAKIADRHGVKHFMDMNFHYRKSGLLLSLSTVEAATGKMTWSKTYNSEVIASRDLREAIKKKMDRDYVHHRVVRPIVYFMTDQDASGYKSTMAIGVRGTDTYDAQSKEVGLELNYYVTDTTFSSAGTNTSIYSSVFNMTALFVHAWNLDEDISQRDEARSSFFVGLGGMYSDGYLAAIGRLGYEVRMGPRWRALGHVSYRAPAVLTRSGEQFLIWGVGGGAGVSYLF